MKKVCTCCGLEKDIEEFPLTLKGSNKRRARCKACVYAKNLSWRKNNPDVKAASDRAYYEENKDRIALYKKEWKEENKTRLQEQTKEYYQKNKDKIYQRVSEWRWVNPERTYVNQRRYVEKNRSKYTFYSSKRRAAQLNATPKWLTAEDYKEIEIEYQLSDWCSKVMGTRYEVDHIIPLQGKQVCGLHVPWNLRVIPEKDNRKKGNKLDCANE